MNFKFYPVSILTFLLAFCNMLNAQTTLYTENFNGGSHSFTLNTTDVSSSNAPGNFNYWIVNNQYTGGAGNAGLCLGILPMSYTFQNTPTQPAGIAGGPTSNYLHITSPGGTLNAGYLGVDNICVMPQNYFTRMSNDVSTNGFSEVSLKFWWIGTGANNSHIELYYSTNGGSSWTMVQSFVANYTFSNPNYVYANNPNWVQQTVSIPQFANQSTLRFGFRLMNGVHNNQIYTPGVGYGFDDFEIIGSNSSNSPTIATSFSPQSTYCPGAQITVPFTSTGTFTGANAYKVQLSDASGSFSSPVEIGSFTSTANAGNIPATIPPGTSQGSAYRIRVVSTSPSVTGTPNTTDFAVAPAAAIPITTDPAGVTNLCTGSLTLSIPAGYTAIQWSPGNQTSNSITVTTPGDYSVSGTSASGCQSQSEVLTITAAAAPVANFTYVQPAGYLVEFTNTSENGVTYSWNFGSATTTSVNPTFTFPFDGDYPVTLIATSPCGSDTITITVEVKKFVGIDDLQPFEELSLYPNPVKETLQLMVKSKGTTASNISIYNAIGGKILDENMVITGEQIRQINFKGFAPGVYFVRISSNKGQSTYRIVKD
jgi:hypothetical protein